MAKKKNGPKTKRIHVSVPAGHDVVPHLKKHVLVPVAVSHEVIEPKTDPPVEFLGVITVEETFWGQTEYLVIASAPNCPPLPKIRTGQLVHVTFAPPLKSQTPPPHD